MKLRLYTNRAGQAPDEISYTLQSLDHKVAHHSIADFRRSDSMGCDAILVQIGLPSSDEVIKSAQMQQITVYAFGPRNDRSHGYPVTGMDLDNLGAMTPLEVIADECPPKVRLTTESFVLSCIPGTKVAFHPSAVKKPARAKSIQAKLSENTLSSVLGPDAFADAPRVIIVGGGQSLKNFDWDLLEGEVVIGSNMSFMKPNVGMCVSMDERWYKWLTTGKLDLKHPYAMKQWEEYTGLKVFLNNKDKPAPSDEWVSIKKTLGKSVPSRSDIGDSSTSGHAAMMIAAAYGAKEIILLGIDMQGKHYHEGYPDAPDPKYDMFLRCFNRAAPILEKMGVNVTVYGTSALKCFGKKKQLRMLIKQLTAKPKFKAVTYYTDDFYKAQAEEMAQTAGVQGVSVMLEKMEDGGSWDANTYAKADFLKSKLGKVEDGEVIVWIDADSRFCKYPKALFDFAGGDADISVARIDWAEVPGSSRTGIQLATGVMCLRKTDATLSLVDEWIKENEKQRGSGKFEQENLQNILKRGEKVKLNIEALPLSHCQIFDLMASIGEPVIKQMQASRDAKKKGNLPDKIMPTKVGSETQQSEARKYSFMWDKGGYIPSKCAMPMFEYIRMNTPQKENPSILEIGFGDGTTISKLQEHYGKSANIKGVDITLEGVRKSGLYDPETHIQASVWELPFEDNKFDITFSTDVLEHIPTHLIPQTLSEIFRVTKGKTFHCIANFDAIHDKVQLHLTQKPHDWWEDRFREAWAKKEIEFDFMMRAAFLKNMKGVAK